MGMLGDIKKLVTNEPPPTSSGSEAKKILIVEDDNMLAKVLQDRLQEEGFSVTQAENGAKGLETVSTLHPNLMILDLMMPVMDGKVMLSKLRTIPEFRNLPVIVLTNAGDVQSMQETHDYLDAVSFMVKSNVTVDEIVKTIKEVI